MRRGALALSIRLGNALVFANALKYVNGGSRVRFFTQVACTHLEALRQTFERIVTVRQICPKRATTTQILDAYSTSSSQTTSANSASMKVGRTPDRSVARAVRRGSSCRATCGVSAAHHSGRYPAHMTNGPHDADELRSVISELDELWREAAEIRELRQPRARDGVKFAGHDLSRMATMYGLVSHVHRTAQAVLVLIDAGHLNAAVPLVRLAFETSLTTAWLAQSKDDHGVAAI